MDLKKWALKTAMAVERLCMKKTAPCVGFSLVFFDPLAPPDEAWNYCIELAFDPNNPPPPDEQERLQKTFQYINEGVKRIMGGGEGKYLNEYVVMEPTKRGPSIN